MTENPLPLAITQDGGSRLKHLGSEELLGLLVGRRWFGAVGHEPELAHVSSIVYADDELELALVGVQFTGGTHSTYVVAVGPNGEDAYEHLPALARLVALAGVDTPCASARAIGVEQSNSSVVLDESVVLKLYRRIEAGSSPEVELLRTLEEAGFASAPRLRGVIVLSDAPLEVTLAVVTDFVPSAGGGWELTLAALAAGDPGWLPARARRLGEVTGSMHASLAATSEAHIAPEEASSDAVGLLAAAVDEDVVRLASDVVLLAETAIGDRVDDLRDLVRDLARVGPPGRVLRIHGDYHLGQVLWADPGDWVVIDFEGEPGRSLAERRRRMFALRDVAGMLRSFAYATTASSLLVGVTAPDGWEAMCRASFVDGWRATVDPRLLPASEPGFERLLALFEVERLVYELRYELANRPDWVGIPVAGLERMLEAS